MRSVTKKEIKRFHDRASLRSMDDIAVEEPLEIFVNDGDSPLLVTMRTPGDDESLVLGLLFNLGMLSSSPSSGFHRTSNSSKIRLILKEAVDTKRRSILQNSSCGLCNSSSWEDVALHSLFPIYPKDFRIKSDSISQLINLLTAESGNFQLTGGCHKIVLCDKNLEILAAAEDVGRHNAFDKVIGQCMKRNILPLRNSIVILSGRCSFEMSQKAWLAGIPIIISLGAPTSKAIELAENAGITLIGFAKKHSFNVYSHIYRIEHEES